MLPDPVLVPMTMRVRRAACPRPPQRAMDPPAPVARELFCRGGVRVDALQLARGGTLFRATLVRGGKLNALSRASFAALSDTLDLVEGGPPGSLLLIASAVAMFSAGGDVVVMRDAVRAAGDADARRAVARALLSAEYALLRRLRRCARPTVAVARGTMLGAGAGLFQSCAARIVTPDATLAMPEPRIALVPDCAASAFFAALPGALGIWAGLTGASITAPHMAVLGLADAVVDDAAADAIGRGAHPALAAEDVLSALRGIGEARPAVEGDELLDPTSDMRRGIDSCFSHSCVLAIAHNLGEMAPHKAWAGEALRNLKEGAPVAVRKALQVLREGCACSGDVDAVEQAFCREEEANVELAAGADFAEGVRARLVDKDGEPNWEIGWEAMGLGVGGTG